MRFSPSVLAALALAACGGPDPAPRPPEQPETITPDAAIEEGTYATTMIGEVGSGDAPVESSPPPAKDHPPATKVKDSLRVTGVNAVDDTSLGAEDVKTKLLQTYFTRIKRCYKDALKQDPTLEGTLDLTFEVNEQGQATPTAVKAPTSALGACVEAAVAKWKFAAPEDDAGEPTTASFTMTFRLAVE